MNIFDFKEFVTQGLGRAIILLKSQADKELYRKELIYLLTQAQLPRVLGQYDLDLINCFDQSEEMSAEFADYFCSEVKKGNYNSSKLPLALMLGYNDSIVKIVESHYQDAYRELLQYTKKGNTDDNYPDCAYRYTNAATFLASCQINDTRIKKIFWDIADLCEYTENPVVPKFQSPIFRLMHRYGVDTSKRILNEVIQEHPFGSKLALFSALALKYYSCVMEPIKNLTAQDILESNDHGKRFHELFISFQHADKAVVHNVAQQILAERDFKRQLFLLSFFSTAVSPYILPPAFPLDPTPLIEKFNELKADLDKMPEFSDSFSLLNMLSFVRHPSIKALGKELLKEDHTQNVHNVATRMYYCSNYSSDEKDEFINLILSKDHLTPYYRCFLYVDLIKLNPTNAPLELVPYVYKSAPSDLRYELVKALLNIGKLPKDLKEESRLDCYIPTRKLVSYDG